jgi:hypothetical protein
MTPFEGIGRGDRQELRPYQTASPVSKWSRFGSLIEPSVTSTTLHDYITAFEVNSRAIIEFKPE